MKTRKEILELIHDEGLAALIEAEMGQKIITRRQISAIKGDDVTKLNALIVEQQRKIDQLRDNLKVVEDMINDEIVAENRKAKAEREAAEVKN